MNQMLAIETPDRFRSQAEAECRRIARDTGERGWLTPETVASIEAELRVKEFRTLIAPLIRIKVGMLPVYGFSFALSADGSLGDRTDRWSESQQKTIALIDAQIAYYAGQCGVGPVCEPPSLESLMELSASPAPRS